MGLKHGKYAYVKVKDNLFVKVRVLKSRDENSPDRYIILNVFHKKIPSRRAEVIELEKLPIEIKDKLLKLL
ncbi:MAG: DUF5622 domain-containing protein [Sulfolobaceae archaeon]